MNLLSLIKWTAVAISLVTPVAVVNMTAAYVDNGVAMTRVSLSEIQAIRLSLLRSDAHSLPGADASILLSRHGLQSIEALQKEMDGARADLVIARADVLSAQRKLLRDTTLGLLCVAISSFAAIAFAAPWPRRRLVESIESA